MVKVIEGGNGATFDLAVNDSTVLDDLGMARRGDQHYAVGTELLVTETLGNGDAVDPAVWETTMSWTARHARRGDEEDLHDHNKSASRS